jgi:hypothetical protein
MMGGEFCGKALRCLARWWADSRPGLPMPLAAEISGCDHPLAVWAAEDSVRAEILYSLEMNSVKTSDSRVVIEARSKQVREEDRDGE